MKYSNDYLNDLAVRLAHHSTAIEGNSLTQGETKSILIDHFIPKGMDEREYFEVKNYQSYMNYLYTIYDQPLSLNIIKDTHKILMEHLLDNNGEFKKIPNIILGTDFKTTEPYLVQSELQNNIDNLNYRFSLSEENKDKVMAIMDFHLTFERIHPFSDGNGRIGRALIVHSCIEQNITPIIITKDIKNEYVNALNRMDKATLYNIAFELQEQEQKRLNLLDNQRKDIENHKITVSIPKQKSDKGLER